MGGASSYYLMLSITGFLTAVWLMGRLSRLIGVSSIVLEVGVGIVLGPAVLNLIPSDVSQCAADKATNCDARADQLRIAEKGPESCDLSAYLKAGKYVSGSTGLDEGFFGNVSTVTLDGTAYNLQSSSRLLASGNEGKTDYDDYAACLKETCKFELAMDCATYPDIFSMLGHTGVAMMIFESGMHFDFEQAKTVGPLATVVAVLGTFLPILAGTGLAAAFGYPVYPDGLSVGVSLAPTSVGIALKLLHEASALHTFFGQAVMTAAFVDDVLSLILFSVLFSLRGTMTFLTFLPLICGCIFMVVAIIAAVRVWPPFMRWIFSNIPETKPNANVTRHHEVMWFLMFLVLLAYGTVTHLCGTHLWGCFIAGMSFATRDEAHHVWVRQVKRVTCWLIRIFFAATLAWAIPVTELFSIDAFWKGSIMGIGPCILTKVLCAPFMGQARWVIGWAMVGRAEFAYFIAIMAKSLKMMDDSLFAILVWALIYATIFAPLIFRYVLKRFVQRKQAEKEKTQADGKPQQLERQTSNSSFTIAELERQISDTSSGGVKRCQTYHNPDEYGDQLEAQKRERLKEADKVSADLQLAKHELARLRKLAESTQSGNATV